jgi:hypothetical protein
MMDPFILSSLKVISPPPKVLLRGKLFSPEILMSPALCQSMVYFIASSLSDRLHGQELPGVSLEYSPDHISGMKCSNTNLLTEEENSKSLGLANKFLLVAEASDQLLMPARYVKNYDYGELILDFREQLRIGYDPGEKIKANDRFLHTVLYDKVDAPMLKTRVDPDVPGARLQ